MAGRNRIRSPLARPNGRLVLYLQGHGGNYRNKGRPVLSALVEAGYDVIGIDIAHAMLCAAKLRHSRFARIREVQADAARIPASDQSVDIVFANLLLPGIDDIDPFFAEVARVLAEDGVFAFASLGPDSFAAMRDAWLPEDGDCHIRSFPDMHDIGDALIRNGLAEPILDVDRLTVTYQDSAALLKDVAMSGSGNCLAGRRSTGTASYC